MSPAGKGPAFLLKVSNGGEEPTYATIAGMRTVSDERNPRGMKISATGIFTGSAAEARLKSNALSGTFDDYELSFESGERVRGRFLVTRLDYAGDYNGERTYALSLESDGAVRVVGEHAAAKAA